MLRCLSPTVCWVAWSRVWKSNSSKLWSMRPSTDEMLLRELTTCFILESGKALPLIWSNTQCMAEPPRVETALVASSNLVFLLIVPLVASSNLVFLLIVPLQIPDTATGCTGLINVHLHAKRVDAHWTLCQAPSLRWGCVEKGSIQQTEGKDCQHKPCRTLPHGLRQLLGLRSSEQQFKLEITLSQMCAYMHKVKSLKREEFPI